MATHDIDRQAERECFLCALDSRSSCTQLEGRVVTANERLLDGIKTPVVILDTGAARVEVQLPDQYYWSLIRELKNRGDVIGNYQLTMRVYHLPSPPALVEYKGRSRRCYKGNAYTLAVLEPDTLLNITDLNMAEYCPRQHMLNRFSPSPASAATIRGNLVHHCFKELLKEHDRGKFTSHTATDEQAGEETALDALHRHLNRRCSSTASRWRWRTSPSRACAPTWCPILRASHTGTRVSAIRCGTCQPPMPTSGSTNQATRYAPRPFSWHPRSGCADGSTSSGSSPVASACWN